jgi:hypothetical protein
LSIVMSVILSASQSSSVSWGKTEARRGTHRSSADDFS